ncbi:serine/threonine transporter SstT [Neisseria gonorrhoeae]|uniref:Serine/threonine transporter SstT n=1 Tax=Neisseria gonorrhoeae TaxID=485 RepID=A0A378W2B6_NEIGO|nr:serine/threonine transporter SstT [Neisseria gonorrhoeae]
MAFGKSLFHAIGRVSLVRQIAAGLALGIVIGSVSPQLGLAAGLFGSLFVGALKAVAPVLVFIWWRPQSRSTKRQQGAYQADYRPLPHRHVFRSPDRRHRRYGFPDAHCFGGRGRCVRRAAFRHCGSVEIAADEPGRQPD